MAAKFSMFQRFIRILAIFLFVEAYHCHKDNAYLNKSAYNVNIFDNPFNLKENKLLSISEAKCHSTNDYIENRQTSEEDVPKLMINKLFKKKSTLKKLDKHCEKKLFKAFSEIHNTMQDHDMPLNKSLKKILKTVFFILTTPMITYLVGCFFLLKGLEWKINLINIYFFFCALSICILIYIFVKLLKRDVVKKGRFRPRFHDYFYSLKNIYKYN
ncbi:Pv-fam-b protein [Plasmodium gonderi]|uniref:Pv-fam-b protein n=1 Tax=Plasmodium gonderi TaxID=77519 RepID=A0A1Y1JP59_PLAGO|nr:Pv-fam-b protein [Plasmodium gonderi]GAW84261.1 Pv-fam-b protein [Plasmodium gonderi]